MNNDTSTPNAHGSGMWDVVILLKPFAEAKTRLNLGASRPKLAWTMARDTIEAIRGCGAVGRIVVVTRETHLREALSVRGMNFLDDPGGGLQGAIRAGINEAGRLSHRHGVAVVTGDLPSVSPAEWDTAFRMASQHQTSFVSDAKLIGTTAFFKRTDSPYLPQFGEQSRQAHRALGAAELIHSTFRAIHRDVDTVRDLREALALGVGRHTEILVRTRHEISL